MPEHPVAPATHAALEPSRRVNRTRSDRLAAAEIEEVKAAEVDRELDRLVGPDLRLEPSPPLE